MQCQESAAEIKTKDLVIESFFANEKYSMKILVGEIIPNVTEKDEFDYQNTSIYQTIFELFDHQHYDGRIEYFGFSIKSTHKNVKRYIGTLMEEIKFIVV